MFDDIKEYLSLNLKDYENIGVDFEINKFLFLVAIGLCVVAFVVNYKRSLMIDTVKQMIRRGATSEESAMTLTELGLGASRGIRKAVLHDSRLRRMVKIVGEVRPTYEEYVAKMKKSKGRAKDDELDPKTDRIYIPNEALERAKFVYNTYNTSLLKTSLTCVFILAVSICLILASPSILSVVDAALA